MVNLDRLIQQLYAMSLSSGDWLETRQQFLSTLIAWCGAHSGAWLTRSTTDQPGTYTLWPHECGLAESDLRAHQAEGSARSQHLQPLPDRLSMGLEGPSEGFLVEYTHRGGGLMSRVLIRFQGTAPEVWIDHKRAIGHMIEASSLALTQFLQRDEWLAAMGRNARGPAAITDGEGYYYAVTPQFLQLMAEAFGAAAAGAARLPFPLPRPETGKVSTVRIGPVFLRVSGQSSLYLVHARRPRPTDALSPREQQVAHALAEGKTFKRIAQQLGLSSSTVANHTASIYRKLGVFRREDLLSVMRSGVVQR